MWQSQKDRVALTHSSHTLWHKTKVIISDTMPPWQQNRFLVFNISLQHCPHALEDEWKVKAWSRHFLLNSTPPASKSPAPNMDLGAQDQQKNQKSEGLQLDLRNLELDLRFRGGLGLSPIGLENFRGGLSPSPPLNLKSNSKILKSNWTWAKSTSKSQVQL